MWLSPGGYFVDAKEGRVWSGRGEDGEKREGKEGADNAFLGSCPRLRPASIKDANNLAVGQEGKRLRAPAQKADLTPGKSPILRAVCVEIRGPRDLGIVRSMFIRGTCAVFGSKKIHVRLFAQLKWMKSPLSHTGYEDRCEEGCDSVDVSQFNSSIAISYMTGCPTYSSR